MKIGEFAKKHDVTIDTVRHYINEGLLTPLRDNTQYSFSEIDDRDARNIAAKYGVTYEQMLTRIK